MEQLAVLERDDDLIDWSEEEIIDRAGRPRGKSFSKRLGNDAFGKQERGSLARALMLKMHRSFYGSLQKAESCKI